MSGVLILNCGSSTLKWELYPSIESSYAAEKGNGPISLLRETVQGLLVNIKPVLHIVRFVSGGNYFYKPIIITKNIVEQLSGLVDLAPLHNRYALEVIAILLDKDSDARTVAVFDTEYFHDLPPIAQCYGIPSELTAEFNIRRHGFHGFAHRAMLDTWHKINAAIGLSSADSRIISIQLGSGCSMAASRGCQPIDTTMGFSPNEGLLMSTRCGDIDPGLVTWLQRKKNWTPEQCDRVLNEESGWSGMSMLGKDFGVVLKSESDKAQLAVDLFCYRIRKTLGAYYIALGGLDAVLLSGGIAENAQAICHRLLDGLAFVGIELIEPQYIQSASVGDTVHRLTTERSDVGAWIVPCHESRAMLNSVKLALPEAI